MTPQEIRDFIANFNSVDAYTRMYNEYAHFEVGPLCERILELENALKDCLRALETSKEYMDIYPETFDLLNDEHARITKILEGNNQ